MFYKPPKSPAIQLHQASTFMVEDYQDPAHASRPIATKSSSSRCGSRSTMRRTKTAASISSAAARTTGCGTIKFGGEEGFYNAAYTLDFDAKSSEVVRTCRARRASSSSSPNAASTARPPTRPTAIAWRSTCGRFRPAWPCTPSKKYYRSVYNGGKYILENWGVCLLRGEDRYKLSKTIPPEALERGIAPRLLANVAAAAPQQLRRTA